MRSRRAFGTLPVLRAALARRPRPPHQLLPFRRGPRRPTDLFRSGAKSGDHTHFRGRTTDQRVNTYQMQQVSLMWLPSNPLGHEGEGCGVHGFWFSLEVELE
jgi:hypothetical protein